MMLPIPQRLEIVISTYVPGERRVKHRSGLGGEGGRSKLFQYGIGIVAPAGREYRGGRGVREGEGGVGRG